MRNSLAYYFDLARQVANAKDDSRSFKLASVGVRGDGVIVAASNAPCPTPDRRAHSEFRISRKLDYLSTVYVVRVLRADESFAMSKPCPDCQRALRAKRVKKVIFTISPKEYGIWYPQSGIETYHLF